MVDLPPPEGPTKATFNPGATCRLNPLSTCTSGREGYANLHSGALQLRFEGYSNVFESTTSTEM